MAELHFAKGHGLGNDYLVVDSADLAVDVTPAFIRGICDRHRGVGSDGLLVGTKTGERISLRIYNPDGTEAEKSGNGLRIFGAYLYGRGLVGNDWFDVHLVKDTVALRIEQELAGGALMIRAAMGRANFDEAAVSFEGRSGEELSLPEGGSAVVTTVSLSNPHCVVFVDALERTDFLRRAPQLCNHAAFRFGTNVQFARVSDRHTVQAWIWERGVGETQASGSSSCAVAAAAVKRGSVDAGIVRVEMPGGEAEVEVGNDFSVLLRAPAQIILHGSIPPDVAASWQ
ncbi:MAG TPA: diaminopimelate epimerase [Longimicrobiales bacterium]|nr:diaminopimelate epimerase [Longimicrobiales bacterium]